MPAVSFEFVPSALDSALASLAAWRRWAATLQRLARREPGLEFAEWVDAATLRAWLAGPDPNGDSGDVYARAQPGDTRRQRTARGLLRRRVT